MKKQVELNGITYATPNSTCADGDSLILVNLRKKNGSLQPVMPGKQIASLDREYDFIYIHKNNDYENWLGGAGSILYKDITNTPTEIVVLDSKIKEIKSIGNTLILITDTQLFYLLYKDDKYTLLGSKPPFPVLHFATNNSNETVHFTEIDGVIEWGKAQEAMESLLVKTRWEDENAYKLCGVYLVRYAIRMYDGSYILHSSPFFVNPYPAEGLESLLPTIKYKCPPYVVQLKRDNNDLDKNASFVREYFYTLQTTVSFEDFKNWKDLIAGIDIFVSDELGLVHEDFKNIEDCIINASGGYRLLDPLSFLDRSWIGGQVGSSISNEWKNRVKTNIAGTGNFYLVKSIPLQEDEITVTFPDKNDISTLKNLIHQPVLPIDNFSHHGISGDISYVYNQRLHVCNICTTLFQGFSMESFMDNIQKETPALTTYAIDVVLDNKIVSTEYENSKESFRMNPFLSYPDTRATKMIVYVLEHNTNIRYKLEFDLLPHSRLNIAYHVDYFLEKIGFEYPGEGIYTTKNEPVKIFENKIKVSALNNPFVFPNENTYVAGNGKVVALASNAIPVSEGQFGQYPLYVFTEDGIYALMTGSGDIVYSNISPVSREVPVSGSVVPVTDAVFFLTKRGAMLIAGRDTISLSQMLDGEKPAENIEHFNKIIEIMTPGLVCNIEAFMDFIKGSVDVFYNYKENEVIISSISKRYAYVYSFNSKTWYITTHVFSKIENTYPNLYGVSENKILDISEPGDDKTKVLCLSRPVKFGTEDKKVLSRMVLKSYLNATSNFGLFTFSSDDFINFRIKSNRGIFKREIRDLDTGLMIQNSFKSYAYLFAGELGAGSRINYIEMDVKKMYDNDKLR